MTFPDGRVKEGIFKNNIYQNPVTDLNQANQLKTQEILMRNNFKESNYEWDKNLEDKYQNYV